MPAGPWPQSVTSRRPMRTQEARGVRHLHYGGALDSKVEILKLYSQILLSFCKSLQPMRTQE